MNEMRYDEKVQRFTLFGIAIVISMGGFCCLFEIFGVLQRSGLTRGIYRVERQNEKFFDLHDRVKSELYKEIAEIKAGIIDLKVGQASTPVNVQQTNTPATPAAPAEDTTTKKPPGNN